MDNTVLKKRLSTFRTEKGVLKNVRDDLLMDILRAWETWPGTAKDFYSSLGATHRQMAKLIGKAKKLKREGYMQDSEFKEIALEASEGVVPAGTNGIELVWDQGKVIRFNQVEQLLDFLKRAA